MWNTHNLINKIWFTKAINQKLRDIFHSEWYQKVDTDPNYRLFKHKFEFKQYSYLNNFYAFLLVLEHSVIDSPLKRDGGKTLDFRTENVHCLNGIRDEFYYILDCDKLKE